MLSEDASLSETSPVNKAMMEFKPTAGAPIRLTTTKKSNKVFGGTNFLDEEEDNNKANRKLMLLQEEEFHATDKDQEDDDENREHNNSNKVHHAEEDDDQVMDYGRDGLPIKAAALSDATNISSSNNTSMQDTLAQISQNILAARTSANAAVPGGVLPANVHAKVLAQAQAIAASIAASQQQQQATTPAAAEDPKETLKRLVDQIPTEM